jgi:hypothetical protein
MDPSTRVIIEVLPAGPWYDQKCIEAGAQFERRGDAWLVRVLLGGRDLTGRFCVSFVGES